MVPYVIGSLLENMSKRWYVDDLQKKKTHTNVNNKQRMFAKKKKKK